MNFKQLGMVAPVHISSELALSLLGWEIVIPDI
jgi:hypothetical protein